MAHSFFSALKRCTGSGSVNLQAASDKKVKTNRSFGLFFMVLILFPLFGNDPLMARQGGIQWVNLQWPPSGEITLDDEFMVYSRVNIDGVNANLIIASIGFYTTDAGDVGDFNQDWTWVPAELNENAETEENILEYMANIGSAITEAGTYYYVSKFQYVGNIYYGGYSDDGGGIWDGTANVSGVLTVNPPPVRNVSFSVDMTLQNGRGLFDPNLNDKVYLRGEFNNWELDEEFLMSISDDSLVYKLNVDISGQEGDNIEYKFFVETGDDRVYPNNGWEFFGDDFESNRTFDLGQANQDQILNKSFFNDDDSPIVKVEPEEFNFILFENEEDSQELKIFNIGASDLQILDIKIVDDSVEWLSIDGENNAIIPPGGDVAINIIANSGELAPGDYSATVQLTTNDPENETIIVSVKLTVIQLGNFALFAPEDGAELMTFPEDGTEVTVSWGESENALGYTWLAILPDGDFDEPLLSFEADDDGAATTLSLTSGGLDALLDGMDVPEGGSVTIQWTVRAERNDKTRLADAPFSLTLIRAAAKIGVSPSFFSYDLLQGDTASGTLNISNTGNIDLNVTINTQNTWINIVADNQFSVLPSSETDIDFVISTQGLALGNHEGSITIESNDPVNSTLVIPINLTVNERGSVAAPVFQPEPGVYLTGNLTVELTTETPNAQIQYAIGEGDFQVYTGPISLSETTLIRAKAVDPEGEMNPSIEISGTFHLLQETELFPTSGLENVSIKPSFDTPDNYLAQLKSAGQDWTNVTDSTTLEPDTEYEWRVCPLSLGSVCSDPISFRTRPTISEVGAATISFIQSGQIDYKLIGLPFAGEMDAASMLEGEMTYDWRIFDMERNEYSAGSPLFFKDANSLWVISVHPMQVSAGPAMEPGGNDYREIKLIGNDGGWASFSMPFVTPEPFDLGDVIIMTKEEPCNAQYDVFRYRAGTWEKLACDDQIEPNEGYFISVPQGEELNLKFPYTPISKRQRQESNAVASGISVVSLYVRDVGSGLENRMGFYGADEAEIRRNRHYPGMEFTRFAAAIEDPDKDANGSGYLSHLHGNFQPEGENHHIKVKAGNRSIEFRAEVAEGFENIAIKLLDPGTGTHRLILPDAPLLLEQGNELQKYQITIGDYDYLINSAGQEMPQQISLKQNYPNPFNPTTRIGFGLTEGTQVRLEVFDITGRIVAVLADGHWNPGWHQVTFDASNLASGVYLYRLVTESTVQTRKMTLIK